MKVFMTLLIISFVGVSLQETFSKVREAWINSLEPYKPQCLRESEVVRRLADRMVTHGEFLDTSLPLKCYVKCLFLNMKLANVAGEVQLENMKRTIDISDPTTMQAIGSKCLSIPADGTCDQAFRMARCIFKTAETLLLP